MPAQKRATKSCESLRDDAVWLLRELVSKSSRHFDFVDDESMFPEFVRASAGAFQFSSQYKKEDLRDAFDSFQEHAQWLQEAANKKSLPNGVDGRLRKMNVQLELYIEILHQDYVHRDVLYRGGSISISDEKRRASDEAKAKMLKLEREMIRLCDEQIPSAFAKIEKALAVDAAAPKKAATSTKQKRANAKKVSSKM